ncbi:MAG: NAD-dependent deacetylase [Planctomycetota bacterium]
MQESGIPTFRGPGGYWTVGSVNYRSEDLATRAAFERMPEDIWAWYIHRRSVCRAAAPNAAHRSLVALEELLHDRFVLVTQNVDGLHLLAGNTLTRTLEIHGNTDYIRCSRACVWKMPDAVMLFPEGLPATWEKGRPLGEEEKALLKCPRCGKWARPHVLWFDEVYD